MLGDIDVTKKPDKPRIFLAKPDKTIISKLTEAYNIQHTIRLGNLNEISFRIPFEIDLHLQIERNRNINLIHERYLILVRYGKIDEWFVINRINRLMEENGDSLELSAFSLGYELKDKILRQYNTEEIGSKLPRNCSQILNEILVETNWSVGYVDASFDIMYRSFNISSKTVLDFIFEVAETFKAIIEWDTDKRKLNLYLADDLEDQNGVVLRTGYGVDRGFTIGYGHYLSSMNKESNSDEMVTRLKPYGKDNLTIHEVNPTGSGYLEDFSFFMYPFQMDANQNVITSSYYMSDNLCRDIINYNNKIISYNSEFKNLINQKSNIRLTLKTLEAELAKLKIQKSQILDRYTTQLRMETINNYDLTWNGTTLTRIETKNDGTTKTVTEPNPLTLKLKGNRKHAVMVKVINSSTILKYNGIVQVTPASEWILINKESVTQIDAQNNYIDKDVTFQLSGPASQVSILTVEITSNEFLGILYDGTKINSDGLTYSKLTSGDGTAATDWSDVIVGTDVYVENEKQLGWQYDGINSDFVGKVTSISTGIEIIGDTTFTTYEITIDRQLAKGQYIKGYRLSKPANESIIIDKYCLLQKETQIYYKESDISYQNSLLATANNRIGEISYDLATEHNFSSEEIIERNNYIIEKEWANQNYITAQDLYDAAKTQFEKMRTPQTIINVNIVNLFSIVEAQREWDKLKIGDIVRIKYEKINVLAKAKIVEIKIDHENETINLTIANVKDIETDEEKLIKMLYKSISTSTTVDMSRFKWDGVQTDVGEINSIIEKLWNKTTNELNIAANENVVIDRRGITVADPLDARRHLRITHGILAITNDGGNSYKHAITADGIIGERIFGKILAGANLIIDTGDGKFRVDGNGVTIDGAALTITGAFGATLDYGNGVRIDSANGIVVTRSDTKYKTTLNATDGIKIEVNDGTPSVPTWRKVFYVDVDGKLTLNDIKATGAIEATTLHATLSIMVGNINIMDLINNGLRITANWIKADMIEANTITANKIKTSELIVGDNITMGVNATLAWGKVTSKPADLAYLSDIAWTNVSGKPVDLAFLNDIDWNRVKTTVITQGGISSGYILANAIIGNHIAANAIDGKTITGATVQTATSGARVVLDANGFHAYDSVGAKTVYINSATGDAQFSGTITTSAKFDASVPGGIIYFKNGSQTRGWLQPGTGGTVALVADVNSNLVLSSNAYLYLRGNTGNTGGGVIVDNTTGNIFDVKCAAYFRTTVDFTGATVTGLVAKFG